MLGRRVPRIRRRAATSRESNRSEVLSPAESPRSTLPPAVTLDLHAPALDYLRNRLRQTMFDTYLGIPLLKFPEDLRVYEHLLWSGKVEVVVELGTQHGGSALWFRDRLQALAAYGQIGRPRVVSVDLDISEAQAHLSQVDPRYEQDIVLVAGDLRDRALVERVCEYVPSGASCMVVDDSAHTYETTLAGLRGFSPLVTLGGFFVVEDGCVDVEEMRIHRDWPRGVLPAIRDWLSSPDGRRFEQCGELELYGITCHPGGFLRRVS